MLSERRVVLTTILGIIAGFCTWWYLGAIPASEVWTVILSRAVLGFAIGISAWGLNWVAHGILMGIIFSLPGAADAVWARMGTRGFWTWIVGGLIIGFLIELIATGLAHFKPRWTTSPQPHPST